MWTVTQRFLDTAVQSHQIASTCTITTPGGQSSTIPISDGGVQVDRSQQIRRTAPNLMLQGGTSAFALLAIPGTQVLLSHGFVYGGADSELLPMLTGELTTAAHILGDGLISVSVADRWQKLAASSRLFPYTPATTARRVDEIISAVQSVFPGITIRNTASDSGTVGTAQAWTSIADQVASYALDGGMEVYFAPDGALVIRDVPKITDNPAWTIKTGRGGSLKALTRTRPLDKLYNTVVLTPATVDPAQTWTQVIAQITDPNDPRHPNRIGVRPYPYQSPTALTLAQAQSIAAQVLNRITGTTETLDLSALAMPALEGGDIVRVLTPADSGDTIVTHFLQQITVNFATGEMSANTRSNTELAA
jgi:hypothetical protein